MPEKKTAKSTSAKRTSAPKLTAEERAAMKEYVNDWSAINIGGEQR